MNEAQVILPPVITDDKPTIIPVKEMELWYKSMTKFANDILRENMDYGVIPTTQKKSLWKAGAEKLRMAFGLTVQVNLIDKIEKPEENYLDYTYKAIILTRNGQQIAECYGNCNTLETKYRYVWEAGEKPDTQEKINELKTKKQGRWQKYGNDWVWQNRIDNPEPLNLKNTIMKMSQKRAFIGAILMATGASEFFTQDFDLEDLQEIDHSGPAQTSNDDKPDVVKSLTQRIESTKDAEELEKIFQEIAALSSTLSNADTIALRQVSSKRKAELKSSEPKGDKK